MLFFAMLQIGILTGLVFLALLTTGLTVFRTLTLRLIAFRALAVIHQVLVISDHSMPFRPAGQSTG